MLLQEFGSDDGDMENVLSSDEEEKFVSIDGPNTGAFFSDNRKSIQESKTASHASTRLTTFKGGFDRSNFKTPSDDRV